ncbi:monothiol glutaredoxin grx5 [Coelomomyces lativittatus]|nr:monothiol glutaredoxin grx5 [Coelomomyces lativittatus]KAJ1506742.1 monothiol glutaredoxin grx5 [Coelomomyces lativittatus]
MTFPLLSSRLSSRFNLNSLCSIQLFYRSLSKETKTKIEDAIKNDICLFMKGTPEKPMCGFSQGAVRVLDCLGVQPYKSINVLEDTEIREGIKSYSYFSCSFFTTFFFFLNHNNCFVRNFSSV